MWQSADFVMKGERFHSWFALAEDGAEIQLPVWINTALEVQIAMWLKTKEAWDKRVASRALEGKLLAPKSKQKYDT